MRPISKSGHMGYAVNSSLELKNINVPLAQKLVFL